MGSTPLALKCPKCIRRADINDMRARTAATQEITELVDTLRTVTSTSLRKKMKVRHERCGHVWWTTHPDVTGNKRKLGRRNLRGHG